MRWTEKVNICGKCNDSIDFLNTANASCEGAT